MPSSASMLRSNKHDVCKLAVASACWYPSVKLESWIMRSLKYKYVYEHVDALTYRSTACSSSSQNQRHTWHCTIVTAHYLGPTKTYNIICSIQSGMTYIVGGGIHGTVYAGDGKGTTRCGLTAIGAEGRWNSGIWQVVVVDMMLQVRRKDAEGGSDGWEDGKDI